MAVMTFAPVRSMVSFFSGFRLLNLDPELAQYFSSATIGVNQGEKGKQTIDIIIKPEVKDKAQ